MSCRRNQGMPLIAFHRSKFNRFEVPIAPSIPTEPDTRTTNPGVEPVFGLKPASREALRHSQKVRESRKAQELSPEQKLWVAENVSLRGYYDHFMAEARRLKSGRGKMSANTLQKDRQALNRWERYTLPDDWPKRGPKWEGLVIGVADEEDLEDFFIRARGGLAVNTVKSTWNHLRVIFNHAWHNGVLSKHLTPEALETEKGVVNVYSDDQLERAYRAFSDRVDLQVAFVIAVCCGPRTEDVFGLRWDGINLDGRDGPMLEFTARKTRKEQAIPLSEAVVRQIARLPRVGEYLFDGLTEPGNVHPERSRASRERNADIRSRLAAVGINFAKPFQAARATCNERLESHKQGVGQFVLGHALTLNSRSYRKPDKMVRDAIESAPLPPCFLNSTETSQRR